MPVNATKIKARSIIKLKELNITISDDIYTFDVIKQWNWMHEYRISNSIPFKTIQNYNGDKLTIIVDVEILNVFDDWSKDITDTYKFSSQ